MTEYTKSNPTSIRALFDSIAGRYDLGNAVMSGNLHRLWNRRLVSGVLKNTPQDILDICCGTGEITKRMGVRLPQASYSLLDFSEEMLAIAQKRLTLANCSFYAANAEILPFSDSSFDAVTCAYGIRNIQNREDCFKEVYRVLRSGASVGIVELTRPNSVFLNILHRIYLQTIVPLVGRALTSNQDAYTYLCESIKGFVPVEQIVAELEKAGFTDVQIKPQTFGIATLFFARKL
ncbi:MAG: bifunctional demethylmenaquinone methyltransferase/2-methoxy-6-polyprenyl-1,4-benzoquinol methylase UbiE [Chlamydiales bacterium]|nr:bifunctional demethylmenaquinone methyltransferase/2-methoxy-6-polyprenyl-1,4-benzoquinol methylase UbiE [Chlamydiales bacterium]